MGRRGILSLGLIWILAQPAMAQDKEKVSQTRKVLVELYTSQGCDSCPPASDLLGKLAELGYGSDRVVAVGFHVDYFNQPWIDPFSDTVFSRRQLAYNAVQKRDDLYFTPLMMVDGTYPMLGSDRPKALASLAKALKEPATVSIAMTLDQTGSHRTLSVEVAAQSAHVIGRDLLVGVASTEDPVTTRVLSGENAGKTLVEHSVVRSFAYKMTRVTRTNSKTLTFPIELARGQIPARSRVAVFVQDRLTGTIYQADGISWDSKPRLTSSR